VAAVLVHIDLEDDRPHPSSLIALVAGRQLASSWGATLYAAMILRDRDGSGRPSGNDAVQAQLARAGADKIVIALTAAAIAPLWAALGSAWQAVLDQLRPRVVLFGADAPSAAELAPRTGARIGARLFARARTSGIEDVELQDRDGGIARASDSGAAVAMIGRATSSGASDEEVDVLVLPLTATADPRIELAGTAPADLAHACGAIVVLGADAGADEQVASDARRLASWLGGQLVDARAGRSLPLAPELCVAIGTAPLELSGATGVVKIGVPPDKATDGALPGIASVGLAELLKQLERA
jgi:electron transfer flavoprotein alpha subunit